MYSRGCTVRFALAVMTVYSIDLSEVLFSDQMQILHCTGESADMIVESGWKRR